MANIVQITLNPLPDSILIPASGFKGTLIAAIVPDPTLSQGSVMFSASGDLSGDGYPEMVVTGWGGDDPTHQLLYSPVYLFSTNSSGASMLDPMQLLGVSSIPGTSTPRILDLDNNGLNDFFYLAYNETRTQFPASNDFAHEYSQIFLQTAPGHFVVSNMTAGKTLSHNSSLGDFNFDGYADIIAAGGGMEIGYFDSGFFGSEAILYINNRDGTFTSYPMEYTRSVHGGGPAGPPAFSAGSSAAMGDFDNDGKTDIVIADCHVSLGNTYDPNSRNDTYLISNMTLGNGEAYGDLTKLPSPYFEGKPAFVGFPSFLDKPGYDPSSLTFALAEKSHDVKVQTLDINNDGLLDILVCSNIWSQTDGTSGGVLQVLLNKGHLQFEDVTDSTLYNFFLGKSSGHELKLLDVNGDGFLDVYMPETGNDVWSEINPGTALHTWANQILINTGTGKFVQAMWNEFHDLTLSEKSLAPDDGFPGGVHDFKYYPYMLPDGRLGFIKQDWAYTQEGPRMLYFDFRANAVLSTGPNGTDSALQGAPGFSEYFYVTQYPDVAAAVTAGTYTSGLDHFLKVGKAAGNFAFAPNASIHGSDNADIIAGREGNETIAARGGNDTVDGGAGIDTATYSSAHANYSLSRTAAGNIVKDRIGNEGTDTLVNVERLQFTDAKLAIDLDGNAGTTAKILGAVFGAASLSNMFYVGVGLKCLDGGMSYASLMQLALDAAGVTTHATEVNLLWKNLIGSLPTAPEAAPYVDLLDRGVLSTADLGVLAAELDLNRANINLVGLQQTGIEYV